MSARIAIAEHPRGLCEFVHMSTEPEAADCVACAFERWKDKRKHGQKATKPKLCERCGE